MVQRSGASSMIPEVRNQEKRPRTSSARSIADVNDCYPVDPIYDAYANPTDPVQSTFLDAKQQCCPARGDEPRNSEAEDDVDAAWFRFRHITRLEALALEDSQAHGLGSQHPFFLSRRFETTSEGSYAPSVKVAERRIRTLFPQTISWLELRVKTDQTDNLTLEDVRDFRSWFLNNDISSCVVNVHREPGFYSFL
ncbi:hypothetical protein BC629DRAFT_1434818 [Irpex lacteus]|nr:hypothetical protein BC629DRAFT_1434818 [Irpex lacteus]